MGSLKLRRHRRVLTALVLGTWLFALFAATAHACVPGNEHIARVACVAIAGGEAGLGHSSGCEQFCHDDTPVLSVLQLVHDQPAAPPLSVSTAVDLPGHARRRAAPACVRAHSPPDVPILLRSLRLAL